MAPSLSQALHLGFRFNPSPLHAAVYYLPRLIAGEPLHESVARFVHSADVYACEPGALAARFLPVPNTDDRFFFTTRRRQKAGKASRAVRFAGPGSWTSQRSTDVLDGAGVKVGEMTKLRYKKGAVLTDWLMDEFSTCCSDGAVAGDRHRVLCKIYVSPRAPPDSAARNESAAFFAQPAPLEPAALIPQAPPPCKRPAPPPLAKPPCPKRTLAAAVAPAPPVVQPAGRATPVAPAPPRPCAPPQQQEAPMPTLSVARACHMPQQAAARHCPPRPSVPTPTPPVAQAPLTPRPAPPAAACPPAPALVAPPDLTFTEAAAADEDVLWDDFDKVMEETVPMLETWEEMAACSDEDDDLLGDFAKELEDTLPTGEAGGRDPFAAAIAREAN